jgi:ribokinase
MSTPKIVVIGSANVDLVARVPYLPEAGETLLGSAFFQTMGGKGANQAVAAAKLGAEVTLIARVGDDMYGAACRAAYEKAGVKTLALQTTPLAPTGIALIAVADSGENHIIVVSGANAHLSPEDVEKHSEAIRSADAVLLQLEIPLETVEKAVEIAHSAGRRIILNPAPYRPLSRALLEKISVLTPNLTEAEKMLGGALAGDDRVLAQSLLGLGPQSLVLTLSARGALAAGSWGQARIPALPVTPLDTTGAGDAFSAALAVALAEGKALDQAARFASVVSGLAVTREGAQSGLPSRAEVEAHLGDLPA